MRGWESFMPTVIIALIIGAMAAAVVGILWLGSHAPVAAGAIVLFLVLWATVHWNSNV